MESQFRPTGLITLTTDFGLSDPYVGIMKGAILSRHPRAQLIDLSHQVPAFQPALAGFWLSRAYAYFPAGTVHLAVVDPGVGTDRKMVCLQLADQVFIAPDNGLLNAVYARDTGARWRIFTLQDLPGLQLQTHSSTFHGRDIFAPLVAEIAAGRVAPAMLGEVVEPNISDERDVGSGHILWADHYGNLITSVDAEDLAAFSRPGLQWRERVIPLVTSYGFATSGAAVAVINSWNTIEIAIVEGNASQTLGAMAGEGVRVIEMPSQPE